MLLILAIGGHSAIAEDNGESESGAAAAQVGESEGQGDKEKEAEEEKDPGRGRFLPIPIFITEPAIGKGLGAAIAYFHAQKPDDAPQATTGRELKDVGRPGKPPPTVTGLAAAYTNNDTSFIGLGHMRSMREDRYRFVGMIANANIYSSVYAGDIPFNFNMEGGLFHTNFKARMGESDVFLGLILQSVNADITFNLGGDGSLPPLEFLDGNILDNALGMSVTYDTRDDTMMPNKGQHFDLTGKWHNDAIKSDFDYN